MKRLKSFMVIIALMSNSLMMQGCWNYREVERMGIVAGVAIDKGEDDKFLITVELVEFTNEKESKVTSKLISFEGKTIFDACRNAISISGKRLYWSHAKVVIISEKIAREGIVSVLDWFSRDSETRADIRVLVTKGCKAEGILKTGGLGPIKSFAMREMIDNQKSLSKAPQTELWEISNDLATPGKSAIAPVVHQIRKDDSLIPKIGGTAVFNSDKLVGYLSEEETKDLLFILNKLKGGVLVQVEAGDKGEVPVSLEIFSSKTTQSTELENGEAHFHIKIASTVAIDEIEAPENYIEESKRKELESSVDRATKERIQRLIKKVQTEFQADIFGFGSKLFQNNPRAWRSVSEQWNEKFKYASMEVAVDIHIRNSAMLSTPMKVGD